MKDWTRIFKNSNVQMDWSAGKTMKLMLFMEEQTSDRFHQAPLATSSQAARL